MIIASNSEFRLRATAQRANSDEQWADSYRFNQQSDGVNAHYSYPDSNSDSDSNLQLAKRVPVPPKHPSDPQSTRHLNPPDRNKWKSLSTRAENQRRSLDRWFIHRSVIAIKRISTRTFVARQAQRLKEGVHTYECVTIWLGKVVLECALSGRRSVCLPICLPALGNLWRRVHEQR